MPSSALVILDSSLTQAVQLQHLLEERLCTVVLARGAEEACAAVLQAGVQVVAVNADTADQPVAAIVEKLRDTRPDVTVVVYGRQSDPGNPQTIGLTNREPESVAEALADVAARMTAPQDHNLMRGARVLLVDDSVTYREYLRMELEDVGADVVVAGTAAEAFAALADRPIDCVLVDLVLPGIDGIRLCTELDRFRRERRQPFHIVTVTSREDTDRMLEALSAGADDFLGKSQPTPILMARLSAHLRRVNFIKMLNIEPAV